MLEQLSLIPFQKHFLIIPRNINSSIVSDYKYEICQYQMVKKVTKFLIDFGGNIDHIEAGELRVPEELHEWLVTLFKVDALVCVSGSR